MTLQSIIIGGLLGFACFIVSISLMEGIFIRPNEKGKKIFTLASLWGFLKAPFQLDTPQYHAVWATNIPLKNKPKLWSTNWVMWVGLGTGSMLFSKYLLNGNRN